MEDQQTLFETLFLPHLDAAYYVARKIVRRDQDAQDVVQDAYIRALKGFKGFRGDNARSWILKIVRNAGYGWIEKHSSDANLIEFDPTIHLITTNNPLSESLRNERERQLHEALNRLPIELREILRLRDIEGWSYKELASALRVPLGTVMSRLSRARQRLRQEVAGLQETGVK
jgi:RNA polymerase sigma factor (sigma-70 family)